MNSDERKEKKMIIRCLSGDQEAFRTLFDHYFSELYRTAYVLMKSPADADDVVQETFIRGFRSLEQYDINRPFRPWIQRILVNVCKDQWKKRKWFFLPLEKAYDICDSKALCPESESIKDEELQDLTDAVRKLSPKHQSVVALYFICGMRIAEVSETLEIPPGTVKSRLHHAVKSLKRIMDKDDKLLFGGWEKRGEEIRA